MDAVSRRFVPAVNSISEKIDRKLSADRGRVARWEHLYGLGEQRNEMLELQIRVKEDLEREEEEQYPFRPRLVSQPQSWHKQSGSVERRTQMWIEEKQRKINAMAREEQKRELEGCTFKPTIRRPPQFHTEPEEDGDQSVMTTKSAAETKAVKRHIENQRQARKDREDVMSGRRPGSSTVSTNYPSEGETGRKPAGPLAKVLTVHYKG